MAARAYFDSSVFIALFSGNEAEGPAIKSALHELKKDKVRIYTSILTIQEASVLSFRRGTMVTDNHMKVGKISRIQNITKEIAVTAAKYEATVIDAIGKQDPKAVEKHRRKLDCIHLATAVYLNCEDFFTLDAGFRTKMEHLDLTSKISIRRPSASKPQLFPDLLEGEHRGKEAR